MFYLIPYWVGGWVGIYVRHFSIRNYSRHWQSYGSGLHCIHTHLICSLLLNLQGPAKKYLAILCTPYFGLLHKSYLISLAFSWPFPELLKNFCPGVFIDLEEGHSPKILGVTATRVGCASPRGGDLNIPRCIWNPRELHWKEIIGKKTLVSCKGTYEPSETNLARWCVLAISACHNQHPIEQYTKPKWHLSLSLA